MKSTRASLVCVQERYDFRIGVSFELCVTADQHRSEERLFEQWVFYRWMLRWSSNLWRSRGFIRRKASCLTSWAHRRTTEHASVAHSRRRREIKAANYGWMVADVGLNKKGTIDECWFNCWRTHWIVFSPRRRLQWLFKKGRSNFVWFLNGTPSRLHWGILFIRLWQREIWTLHIFAILQKMLRKDLLLLNNF